MDKSSYKYICNTMMDLLQPEHSDTNEILSQLITSASSSKLLQEPFAPSDGDGKVTTPLFEAISQKKLGAVMLLLYAGVPTNTVVNGITALHHAVSQSDMTEEVHDIIIIILNTKDL